jgi:hypothetical protein
MKIQACLVAAALCALQTASAKSLDAESACPPQRPIAMLRHAAEAPWAGGPLTALKVPAFARAHAAGTKGEAPWLRRLSGGAGANRVYLEPGHRIIVLAVCNPTDCDGERAYVAFEPATGDWGANVFEGRQIRALVRGSGQTTLAMHPEPLDMALVCAANADMDARDVRK